MDYQFYLLVLAYLFIAEEIAIAYMHPVISILKLRLFGAFNLIVYTCIKRYIVLFSQNLSILLNLLLSPILTLQNVIYIIIIKQG